MILLTFLQQILDENINIADEFCFAENTKLLLVFSVLNSSY